MFKLFFTTDIPGALRFKSFGLSHFALVMTAAAIILLFCMIIKRLDMARRKKILRVLAVCVPCVYVSRFLVFVLLDIFVEPQIPIADLLPLHLCSLNAIVMPLAIFGKNKTLLNYVYAVALPAAAAAMLTPAMSYYGRYSFISWQVLFFYADHGLMLLVAVLCVMSGLVRPDYRQIPQVLMFLVSYSAIIYAVNKISNQNYLFLNHPDQGTVMALFAHYLGNPGYLLPLAAIAIIIIVMMYAPWMVKDRASSEIRA